MELVTIPPLQDARVVSGRHRVRAELVCEVQELRQLDAAVAAHAGARRVALEVAVHERLDHDAPEKLAPVEGVVREAETIGDSARIVNVLRRAAATLDRSVVGVIPEMERDTDHLEAL